MRKNGTFLGIAGYWRFVIPILGALCLLVSCTEFFSTSLAPWAARDPNKLIPPVTLGNVGDLIEMAENNADMSLAVLKGIDTAVKKASGDNKTALQAAALEAAVNAAGLGSAVLNNADKLTTVDEDNAVDLVVNAINGMKNLEAACDTLMSILPDPVLEPEAFDAFAEKAGPEELAMAAAMLLAGAAKEEAKESGVSMSEYIETFSPDNEVNSESANVAAALALVAAIKFEEVENNGPLKQLLDGLNLLPSGWGLPPSDPEDP
jgi:hypothetical protein